MNVDQDIRDLCHAVGLNGNHSAVDWDTLRAAFVLLEHGMLHRTDWWKVIDRASQPVWNPHTDRVRLEDDPPFTVSDGYPLPPGTQRDERGGPLEYPWVLVARKCGCPEIRPGSSLEVAVRVARVNPIAGGESRFPLRSALVLGAAAIAVIALVLLLSML